MANEYNGRDQLPFPQLDSDFIDYDNYSQQSANSARQARGRHAQHGQQAQRMRQAQPNRQARPTQQAQPMRPAGGYVPASQASSRQRRAGQGAHGAVQGGYMPAGAANGAGQYARSNAMYQNRKKGMSTGKKVGIICLIIALVAAVGTLAFFAVRMLTYSAKDSEVQKGFNNGQLVALQEELDAAPASYDEPFTVLLLGSDARSDDPDMGARTDTIVLVRVDTQKKIISMMSIPRDTMVQIDGAGTNKINAAYYYGGPAGSVKAVRDLTGVEINHYAAINFEELVGLIDAIGGIDVEVDETIDDPDAGDVVIEEGKRHLNGEEALTFSRSRAFADGDYTRQRNQRKVIDGILQKGLHSDAASLSGIINQSLNFVTTDMKTEDIKSIADQLRHGDDSKLTIYSANIPSQPATINGVSYVIADTAGVAEMASIFEAGGDISQPITASSISTDLARAGAV